ncbi:hypothetical protein DBV15_06727 [Temnothorax longispinosus]|uniref:Uncharacterized protein n=1 Tax=Temnothorax longispinosus TaxID=300112 RepID=A0A4V3S7Q9_9HYME|nr:hypothetical protein DBV15_06727 [Temnothorax longispinosus]
MGNIGHDAVDTSQLRRLTENRDRHMCQTYPGYRHRQAGQARIGRSVIRLRADKLCVAHYENRGGKSFHPSPSWRLMPLAIRMADFCLYSNTFSLAKITSYKKYRSLITLL